LVVLAVGGARRERQQRGVPGRLGLDISIGEPAQHVAAAFSAGAGGEGEAGEEEADLDRGAGRRRRTVAAVALACHSGVPPWGFGISSVPTPCSRAPRDSSSASRKGAKARKR